MGELGDRYIDPIWEADAPKFYDFKKIDDDDSKEVDAWFENYHQIEIENIEIYKPDTSVVQSGTADSDVQKLKPFGETTSTKIIDEAKATDEKLKNFPLQQFQVLNNEINKPDPSSLVQSGTAGLDVQKVKNSGGSISGKCEAKATDEKLKKLSLRQNRSQSVDRLKSREPLTIPVTPELSTASRVRSFSRDNVKDVDVPVKPFRASPVPKNLLASPTIVKPKARPVTKAVAPQFETDRRLAHRRSFRSLKPASPSNKPVTTGFPKQITVPIKPHPLPPMVPVNLPPKCMKSPTIARPFHFETDLIHENYRRKLQEKLNLEEKARKRAAEFRASSAVVLEKPPFLPSHEVKNPLPVEEFSFKTAERAQQWQQFDQLLKIKENEKDAVLRERRIDQDQADQQFIQEFRMKAVHKAQPVKKYKDVEPRAKPEITVPKAPHFSTDDRLRERHDKKH